MKKITTILLVVTLHFGFAQKKYDFNLYTIYEETSTFNNDKSLILTFSDTIKNVHKLSVNIKNDTINRAYLTDFRVFNSYTFDIKNKKIENLDFFKDFSSSYKKLFRTGNFNMSEICNRYKYYDRDIKKLNDSIEVETFTFYEKRNKKEIKYLVTIEILIHKKTNNIVPSDFTSIINDCIDNTYNSKVINKINTISFREDGSKYEDQLKLIEINTTNFSINTQE